MSVRVLHGDCRKILPTLPAESVNCCVTSPPYWGLRDYGTATWEGGDDGCDHARETKHQAQGATSARAGRSNADAQRNENFRDACGKCGARRVDSQIGLEPTPEAYVEKLVAVFREVRRVLRADGVLFLNLGDSYAGSWGNHGRKAERGGQRPVNGEMLQRFAKHTIGCDMGDDCKCGAGYAQRESNTGSWVNDHPTLKPKDLIGIPWRAAFALQADGWYLRSDIIWAKPNPMPESVTDRPTKSHEYVFLLTKSARYWYDADAIREADSGQDHARTVLGGQPSLEPTGGLKSPHRGLRTVRGRDGLGRNARTVWTITTQPYSGAHFATFPPELARRCVRAGCPPLGTVLDPFSGSGTTGAVAIEEGRAFIGIELNPGYCTLAEKRLRGAQPPLFVDGAA